MKILFTPYTGGSIAHVVRSLAIADVLKKRGHEILFSSSRKKIDFIKNAGYEVFGQGHEDVNLNDENDQGISYFKNNKSKFLSWFKDEISAAKYFQPDIVVNSPSFFGPITGRKLNIPYVTICNAQWLSEYKGLLGLAKSEDNLINKIIRNTLQPVFRKKFEDLYLKEIQGFYNAMNISQIPRSKNDLHNDHPIIIPSFPQFEPITKYDRSDIHYVGPLFWNGFENIELKIERFFSEMQKPFIYVTLGGSVFKKEIYDRIIESFDRKTEWNILINLGPNFKREDFQVDNNHLTIQQYVPGLKLCELASVIVTTGGHGTVMQGIWHGTPLICIPHNIDQATIAQRVAELGLGYNLNPLSILNFTKREKYFQKAVEIAPQKIINEINRVLSNELMNHRAKNLSRETRENFDRADEKAADIIERYGAKK